MKPLAILAMALLTAGCLPDSGPPADPDRPSMTEAEKAGCLERGGIVSIAGLLGGEFCAELLPDAGQACERAQDCTGMCMAETRTCQTHGNPFGCNAFLDENGQELMICAD